MEDYKIQFIIEVLENRKKNCKYTLDQNTFRLEGDEMFDQYKLIEEIIDELTDELGQTSD